MNTTKSILSKDFILMSIGQFLYGFVFEHIGSRTYLPFYAAALVAVGIGFLSFRLYRKTGIEIKQQIEEM